MSVSCCFLSSLLTTIKKNLLKFPGNEIVYTGDITFAFVMGGVPIGAISPRVVDL
jgi:hypothetical protein